MSDYSMTNDDEKFFEALADQRNPTEKGRKENSKVKLAKAKPARPKEPRLIKEKLHEYDEGGGQLTVDVYHNPKEIIIESAIAGIKPEDLDVNVSPDMVTIRGERNRTQEIQKENYFYQECYWGKFSRSIILPQEIDHDAATVNFKNGILTVRLPKLHRSSSKKLRVRVE